MGMVKNSLMVIFLLTSILQVSLASQLRANPLLKNGVTMVGPGNPHRMLTIKVWLKFGNQSSFNQLAYELYDPHHTHYQQFLQTEQFNTRYAPTEIAVDKVKQYLSIQGLKITQVDPNHHYIAATGSIAQLSKIFHVQINNYRYKQSIGFANATLPVVDHSITQWVSGISGLSNIPRIQPMLKQLPTGLALGVKPSNVELVCGLAGNLSANLVDSLGTILVPNMNFKGFLPCSGYTGQELIQTLNSDIPGIDGSGQSIVIIDAFGSSTILEDVNSYSQANGLPLLTADNFMIATPQGTPTCDPNVSDCDGWALETTLDVEAVHTIAPGAKIILVLGDDNNLIPDLVSDVVRLAPQSLGFSNAYVISNSWGITPEFNTSAMESIFQAGAIKGLSFNFASGDTGDNSPSSSQSVDYPASSTWVTAVGGSSLFSEGNTNYLFETGWGSYSSLNYTCTHVQNNQCQSYQASVEPYAFYVGSGGGISIYYPAQPQQQAAISHLYAGGYRVVGTPPLYSTNPLVTFRALPDIAMVADPFTGLNIIFSSGGEQQSVTIGGTSLSTPLFTATLALVNQQRALLNKSALGLAATYLYNLPTGALNIINNPHGIGNPLLSIPNPNVFQLFSQTVEGNLIGHTFNQDTSLTLGQPWGDIVGVGSPNIPNFVSVLGQI